VGDTMKLAYKIPIIWISFLLVTVLLSILQQTLQIPSEIILPRMGPALVTLLFVFVFFPKEYTMKEFLVQEKHSVDITFFIFLFPIVLAVVAKVLHSFISDPYPELNLFDNSMLWLVILWIPFGAFFEEIGWRNYLQRIVDKNEVIKPVYGYIIIGVLWSVWHVQSFEQGPLYVTGLFLLLISFSILLGDIIRRRGQNIITATVTHASINLSMVYLMVTSSFTALTMLIYGLIFALFTIYYLFNEKKIYKT